MWDEHKARDILPGFSAWKGAGWAGLCEGEDWGHDPHWQWIVLLLLTAAGCCLSGYFSLYMYIFFSIYVFLICPLLGASSWL